jgi:hypothetical protein
VVNFAYRRVTRDATLQAVSQRFIEFAAGRRPIRTRSRNGRIRTRRKLYEPFFNPGEADVTVPWNLGFGGRLKVMPGGFWRYTCDCEGEILRESWPDDFRCPFCTFSFGVRMWTIFILSTILITKLTSDMYRRYFEIHLPTGKVCREVLNCVRESNVDARSGLKDTSSAE